MTRTRPKRSYAPYAWKRHDDVPWQTDRFKALVDRHVAVMERALVLYAHSYAVKMHERQIRHGGAPYVVHPIRIANILMDEWDSTDADVVAAALLHDIVEDTGATIKDVKQAVGGDIGVLVDGLTMWKGSDTHETYLKRVARGDERLRLIKCADTLDNLRSWPTSVSDADEKFPRWWKQAKEFVLPMALKTNGDAARMIRNILEDPWYRSLARMS